MFKYLWNLCQALLFTFARTIIMGGEKKPAGEKVLHNFEGLKPLLAHFTQIGPVGCAVSVCLYGKTDYDKL